MRKEGGGGGGGGGSVKQSYLVNGGGGGGGGKGGQGCRQKIIGEFQGPFPCLGKKNEKLILINFET